MAVPDISIKIESAALRAQLRGMPAAITRGMHAAAFRASERFLAFHRRVRLRAPVVGSEGMLRGTGSPRPPGQAAPPGVGFVSARTAFVFGGTVDSLTLSMGIKGKVAALHETGGIQTAGGRLLAVPMPAAKDSKKKVSKEARQALRDSGVVLRSGGKNFSVFGRSFRGLVKITSKVTGKEYLARVNPGKKGLKRLTYLFHLEKSVRVKPRLEFYSTWRTFRPKAMEIFRQALPHAIAAAGRKLAAKPPGGA